MAWVLGEGQRYWGGFGKLYTKVLTKHLVLGGRKVFLFFLEVPAGPG